MASFQECIKHQIHPRRERKAKQDTEDIEKVVKEVFPRKTQAERTIIRRRILINIPLRILINILLHEIFSVPALHMQCIVHATTITQETRKAEHEGRDDHPIKYVVQVHRIFQEGHSRLPFLRTMWLEYTGETQRTTDMASST